MVLVAVTAAAPVTQLVPPMTVTYVPQSTRFVCWLTGGREVATRASAGLVGADLGYSFQAGRQVWWLFGDSLPTLRFAGKPNAESRWPFDQNANGNDSVAISDLTAPGICPVLRFVKELRPVPGAYADPWVTPDPGYAAGSSQVSLRTNETPVAGLVVRGHLYATFSTDNPVDACQVARKPNCTPRKYLGHSTRAVMGELVDARTLEFRGLYNLSAPTTRYGSGAKLVSNAMALGAGGYVYIWGVEGDLDYGKSAPYLARIPAATISTGRGLEFFDGVSFSGRPVFAAGERNAVALFHDDPDCMSHLGVQYNPFVREWIMLYNCGGKGVEMRSAQQPWGTWSKPQLIFSLAPNRTARTGYCYFMHEVSGTDCPPGAPNPPADSSVQGAAYAPYFVAGWTTGTYARTGFPASSTFYYTISTFSPYAEVILRSTIRGPIVRRLPCRGIKCA